MRTTRKQFPVKWLTSGRLAFTIQRAKARRRQQIKKMALVHTYYAPHLISLYITLSVLPVVEISAVLV